ncbi:hypothetical protein JT359_20065 [Candidatus Poribacteria bacterium]|nr:hypothetical protein [Candidatus Poribacteria bacterium]
MAHNEWEQATQTFMNIAPRGGAEYNAFVKSLSETEKLEFAKKLDDEYEKHRKAIEKQATIEKEKPVFTTQE